MRASQTPSRVAEKRSLIRSLAYGGLDPRLSRQTISIVLCRKAHGSFGFTLEESLVIGCQHKPMTGVAAYKPDIGDP
jgi:hypothetical protein